MCNLNIIFKKKGVKQHTSFTGLLQAATGHSYLMNDDGEGAYFSSNETVVKSLNKINFVAYNNLIHESRVIITHQRISTSGHSEKYLHPFVSDDFVLVHNGILSGYDGGKHSDTYGLFKRFNKAFRKQYAEKNEFLDERENVIVKVLKECLDFQNGSYSILLFDRKTQLGYYMKNSSTTIHFFGNKEYLFIATANMSSLFTTMMKEFKVEDLTIYRIDETADCFKIGDLEPGKTTFYSTGSYWRGGEWRDWENTDNYYVDQYNVKRNKQWNNDGGIKQEVAQLFDLDDKNKNRDGYEPPMPKSDDDDLYICGRCNGSVYVLEYDEGLGEFICTNCQALLENMRQYNRGD